MLDDVLNEISMRFIIPLADVDKEYPERLYFLVEEAYWFYLDFYKHKNKLTLRQFAEAILKYNNIQFKESDHRNFLKYKKEIPVYGALIINQKFDKVLLVQGYYSNNYFFPKGKKNRDELPRECAVREVYEEIGFNIENKLLNYEIRISPKFVVFPVVNVNEKTVFTTLTRNEIKDITWIPIDEIMKCKSGDLKQINEVFGECYSIVKSMDKNRFRFNTSKFEGIFNKTAKAV